MILDPLDYQVKDDQFERHYSCCLKESLDRARERKPLFSVNIFKIFQKNILTNQNLIRV